MYLDPKNVELPPGTYQKLDNNEVIKADDFVRNTSYIGYGGHSDTIDYGSIRAMNWQLANTMIPAWVGKSLQNFYDFSSEKYPVEVLRKIP